MRIKEEFLVSEEEIETGDEMATGENGENFVSGFKLKVKALFEYE